MKRRPNGIAGTHRPMELQELPFGSTAGGAYLFLRCLEGRRSSGAINALAVHVDHGTLSLGVVLDLTGGGFH